MGNEMMPKPANVPTPAQVTGAVPQSQSMFLPDESIWKRYSSHQEFPLSVAASVVLHLFAAGIVVLGGVLVFSFGNRAGPADLEAVVFAGGGGSGTGVGDPNGPEMLQDAMKFDPNNSDAPQQEVKIEDYQNVVPDGDVKVEEKRQEQTKINEQLARGENKPGITGDRGEGGSGRGGGQGNGFGGGYGDGVGKGRNTSKRSLRQTRWTIVLPREDPELFLKKLVQIKAILLLPEGDSVANFKICENLEKRPVEFKAIDQKGINSYNRLWYMSHEKTDCDYVAKGLYLTNTPRWIAIFIPQDLEQEMARQEFNFKKMSEDELNNRKWITIFEVDRKGDAWDVRIRYQGPRKR
jgi:hypothetical protein